MRIHTNCFFPDNLSRPTPYKYYYYFNNLTDNMVPVITAAIAAIIITPQKISDSEVNYPLSKANGLPASSTS